MNADERFYSGSVEASIATLLERAPSLLSQFEFMLLTSLDSETDLRKVRVCRQTVAGHPTTRFLGGGLLLPSTVAMDIGIASWLNGFDEMWCFNSPLWIEKPRMVSIVSPFDAHDPAMLAPVKRWMQEVHCLLGLGDGAALNYVTPSMAVAEDVEVALR